MDVTLQYETNEQTNAKLIQCPRVALSSSWSTDWYIKSLCVIGPMREGKVKFGKKLDLVHITTHICSHRHVRRQLYVLLQNSNSSSYICIRQASTTVQLIYQMEGSDTGISYSWIKCYHSLCAVSASVVLLPLTSPLSPHYVYLYLLFDVHCSDSSSSTPLVTHTLTVCTDAQVRWPSLSSNHYQYR